MAYWGNEPAKVAVKVGSGVITTTEIQDGQVYTADILDNAITASKLDDDGTGFQVGSLGIGTAVSGSDLLKVGGSASFTGDVTAPTLTSKITSNNTGIEILYNADTTYKHNITAYFDGASASSSNMTFKVASGLLSQATPLILKGDSSATFGGDVAVSGSITQTGTGNLHLSSATPSIKLTDTDTGADNYIICNSAVGGMEIQADGGNEVGNSKIQLMVDGSDNLVLNSDKSATFAGDVNLSSGKKVYFGGARVAIGYAPSVTADNSVGIGYAPEASGANSFAFGYNSKAQGDNSFVVGYANTVSGDNSIGIGYNMSVTGNNSVGLGYSSTVSANNLFFTDLNFETSGNATFAGDVTIKSTNKLTVGNSDQDEERFRIANASTGSLIMYAGAQAANYNADTTWAGVVTIGTRGGAGSGVGWKSLKTAGGCALAVTAGTVCIGGDESYQKLSVLGGNIYLSTGYDITWANGNAVIGESGYALEFDTYNGSALTRALTLAGDNKATFGGSVHIAPSAQIRMPQTDTNRYGAVQVDQTDGAGTGTAQCLRLISKNDYGSIYEQRITMETNGAERFIVEFNGVCSGDLNDTSDVSLKKTIKPIESSLDIIKELNPVSFYWKKGENRGEDKQKGFIAQEVESVIPEVVHGEDGNKSINVTGIVAQLTKALQELSDKVEALENA